MLYVVLYIVIVINLIIIVIALLLEFQKTCSKAVIFSLIFIINCRNFDARFIQVIN